MSISTRNTSIQKPNFNRNFNYFGNTGPKNLYSEHLNNTKEATNYSPEFNNPFKNENTENLDYPLNSELYEDNPEFYQNSSYDYYEPQKTIDYFTENTPGNDNVNYPQAVAWVL